MNVPTIPTDNLYKFLAVFGLILFVVSNYLDYKVYDKLTEIIYSSNVQTQSLLVQQARKLEIKNEEAIFITNLFDKSIPKDSLIAQLRLIEKLKNIDSVNILLKRLLSKSENHGRFQRAMERYMQSDSIIKQRRDLGALTKLESNKVDKLDSMTGYLFWIGLSLMLYGFGGWYYKLQRYIDAETKYNNKKYLTKIGEKKDEV